MDDNVVKFYPMNAAKNPDNVLEQAIGKYKSVLIIGVDKEGLMDARASIGQRIADILFLMEQFKHNLLSGTYGDPLLDEVEE